MSARPRLKYNSINVDFDRFLNDFQYVQNQIKAVNVSASGIKETLSFYSEDALTLVKERMSQTVEAQLAQWWEWAKSGQTFSFWFDRDHAGYWPFEKTLTNNNGITGTFARTGAANYTDLTSGLVASAAANTARYQAGKFGHGLLIEGALTQICLYSDDFSNAAWTKTNVTIAADSTNTLDIEGNTTADRATLGAATGTIVQDLSGAADIGTQNGVFSVYAKWSSGSGTNGTVTLRIKRADTGATLSASAALTVSAGSWQRFSIYHATGGAIAAKWRLEIELSGNGDVYYLQRANFDTTRKYTTSSLAAVAASTSRNGETLSYAASNFFDDEPKRGSICFWMYPLWDDETETIGVELFDLERNGSTTSAIELTATVGLGLQFDVYGKSGSTIGQASYPLASITYGNWIHIGCTWDTTISNGIKIYIDGVNVATSTSSPFEVIRRGTNFVLGTSADGSGAFADVMFDDLEIRKDVLTAYEVSARYNASRALGFRKNYFSSLVIDQDVYDPRLLQGTYRHDLELNFIEQKS